MDLKKYDELRNKIHTKDFEGRNKSLDYWLYRLSFLGNIGSIFFAFFLISPALEKTISINIVSGGLGIALSIILTIGFLISFEVIKRILIKNFSFSLVKNKFKILKGKILGWFIFSAFIITLSFYFSLNGAKNFASTSFQNNQIVENNLQDEIDSLRQVYEEKKQPYIKDNEELREINNEIRKKYTETPLNYRTVRNDYQESIDKNTKQINENENEIDQLDNELEQKISQLRQKYKVKTNQNKKEEEQNIWLFILISSSIEILIILGVYFREFYEYNVYLANHEKLEKVYQKRDRYRAMLTYIYREGKAEHGERVMGAQKLIELVSENTTIHNPKSFVENFLRDMENLEVFIVQGKRRLINASYQEALNIIENFDDALRILKNMK
jgi:hypothetical protein